MTASAAPPNGDTLLAVIAAGAGPHVSIADELTNCLTMVDEDPERFRSAAASWHARWCIDLAPLTLTDSQTALTALQAIAGPRGTEAAGVLRYLCLLHGQRGTPDALERWIALREGGAAPTS